MTDNMTLVQNIKRYLHQAEVNSDGSIDVCLSDIDSNKANVVFGCYALEAEHYLKVIGLKMESGCFPDKNPFSIEIFKSRKSPDIINVVLAENFGTIDDNFELIYHKRDGEVWINEDIFVKGFKPGNNYYQVVFEECYDKAGQEVKLGQLQVFNYLKVARLDTAIENALHTLTPEGVRWFFPVLRTKVARCEPMYFDVAGTTVPFQKKPKHYELDPFQRGEWSDD